MFIRRTSIKSRTAGEDYFTHRLVESERIDGHVKQRTLLNLGRHFAVPQAQWKALCARIEQLIAGQPSLFDSTVSTDLEQTAQRYASRLLAKQSEPVNPSSSRYAEVDVNTIELVRPRSVGIEHLALHAVQQLGLESLLQELGLNRHQRAAALGNIIGRMTARAVKPQPINGYSNAVHWAN